MIFDEYGGSENLKHFYGFDNEEFLTALEERGFSVSRTSKNTESPWTVTLVPNMLNMDYVTSDAVPINSRKEWMEEPALYRLFWENGYRDEFGQPRRLFKGERLPGADSGPIPGDHFRIPL